MAKQHIYTNVKKGLYSGKSGYDTAQASDGLSEDYVKRRIHKYCFYERHSFHDEEKESDPPVYFASPIHTVNGAGKGFIFGRNIFVRDIRNSFLAHAIIVLEGEELKDVYENYDFVLDYVDFYNTCPEFPLPDITLSQRERFDMFYCKDFLFDILRITKEGFVALLYYSIFSIVNKKQVWIKLNAKRLTCSPLARQLMRFIVAILPLCIRKKLSFITYTPSYSLPQFFNIIFVDPALDLENIKGDYTLDLQKPIHFRTHYNFLNLMWHNTDNANRIINGFIVPFYHDIGHKTGGSGLFDELEAQISARLDILKQICRENLIISPTDFSLYLNLSMDVCSIQGTIYEEAAGKLLYAIQHAKITNRKTDIKELAYFFQKKFKGKEIFYIQMLGLYEKYTEYFQLMKEQINETERFDRFILWVYLFLTGIGEYFSDYKNSEPYRCLTECILKKADSFKQNSITEYDLASPEKLKHVWVQCLVLV